MQKPIAVDIYNHSMNGVDRYDRHCMYYSFLQKTLKWWRKMCLLPPRICHSEQLYILRQEARLQVGAKPLTALISVARSSRTRSKTTCRGVAAVPLLVGQGWDPLPFVSIGPPRSALHLLQLCGLQWTYEAHNWVYYCKTCPE